MTQNSNSFAIFTILCGLKLRKQIYEIGRKSVVGLKLQLLFYNRVRLPSRDLSFYMDLVSTDIIGECFAQLLWSEFHYFARVFVFAYINEPRLYERNSYVLLALCSMVTFEKHARKPIFYWFWNHCSFHTVIGCIWQHVIETRMKRSVKKTLLCNRVSVRLPELQFTAKVAV